MGAKRRKEKRFPFLPSHKAVPVSASPPKPKAASYLLCGRSGKVPSFCSGEGGSPVRPLANGMSVELVGTKDTPSRCKLRFLLRLEFVGGGGGGSEGTEHSDPAQSSAFGRFLQRPQTWKAPVRPIGGGGGRRTWRDRDPPPRLPLQGLPTRSSSMLPWGEEGRSPLWPAAHRPLRRPAGPGVARAGARPASSGAASLGPAGTPCGGKTRPSPGSGRRQGSPQRRSPATRKGRRRRRSSNRRAARPGWPLGAALRSGWLRSVALALALRLDRRRVFSAARRRRLPRCLHSSSRLLRPLPARKEGGSKRDSLSLPG